MNRHELEVSSGQRFEFGANWQRFLSVLSDSRIEEAKKHLQNMLGVDTLEAKTFLDIGSGSGLFSLVARMLGAEVCSFDFDPKSVACTDELKKRYFSHDQKWRVARGSVLDKDFLEGLGRFDVVYSWGVLHHTGAMWKAIENATKLVNPGGKLFIAIYNDQGSWSRRWKVLKRIYNKLPQALKLPYALIIMGARELNIILVPLIKLKFGVIRDRWAGYGQSRGMSRWYDMIDWIGGYPFEVAKPEDIFMFLKRRGFTLEMLTTTAGDLGCNEYVFTKR
jgi:2-polyprenyl-3-methyl-5-hydroxy-6-metoxy-1,4-benzoquinol methylase